MHRLAACFRLPPMSAIPDVQLLYTGHHQWLQQRLQHRLGNAADAQDMAADTFVCVLTSATPPDAIREPRAFLTTIAKRLLINHWRRRDLERSYLEALGAQPEPLMPSPEELAVLQETLAHVANALDGLSLPAQQAFLLSQLDGLGYEAIAERLGISHSTVRRHMAEGFRRIALALARQDAGIAAPVRSAAPALAESLGAG